GSRDGRSAFRATRGTPPHSDRRPEMARIETPTIPPDVAQGSPLATQTYPSPLNLPTCPSNWPLPSGLASCPSIRPSHLHSFVQITSVSALPLPSPEIRISIPTAIQHASMNDPPYEKNGNGIPAIGMRFSVIPTLIITCTNHRLTNPNATRLENESVARPATLTHRRKSTRNNTSATVTPTTPSSSPTTGKMKSVCCAGRNARRFCVPIVNPLPSQPPDPIATCDWITWYPDRSGSEPGSRNTSSRRC